jgi:hypothetical protein
MKWLLENNFSYDELLINTFVKKGRRWLLEDNNFLYDYNVLPNIIRNSKN